jgi:hypothetical protein
MMVIKSGRNSYIGAWKKVEGIICFWEFSIGKAFQGTAAMVVFVVMMVVMVMVMIMFMVVMIVMIVMRRMRRMRMGSPERQMKVENNQAGKTNNAENFEMPSTFAGLRRGDAVC